MIQAHEDGRDLAEQVDGARLFSTNGEQARIQYQRVTKARRRERPHERALEMPRRAQRVAEVSFDVGEFAVGEPELRR